MLAQRLLVYDRKRSDYRKKFKSMIVRIKTDDWLKWLRIAKIRYKQALTDILGMFAQRLLV